MLVDVQAVRFAHTPRVRGCGLDVDCAQGGWSQALADRSGLHRAHIGDVERGQTNVTLQTLKTLADTFHVRITDLLKGL